MTRSLPYPEFTWTFTQHAPGLVAETLYKLLESAAAFEGEINPGEKITALMSAANILTRNARDGVDSAWRDYQQLLPTLGLIYSSLTVRELTLTDLGRMLLSGEIGFSELMSTQALRLQYPNGNNYVMQGVRAAATSTGKTMPSTLTELQAQNGIRIKPGTLTLRVLLELLSAGSSPGISTAECGAFLLPCRVNDEWPIAVQEILQARGRGDQIANPHRHANRNIQDWFKFLSKTDYFELIDGRLNLSQKTLSNVDAVFNICQAQEAVESFWIPTRFDREGRVDWFNRYGSIPLALQGAILMEVDSAYEVANYIKGVEKVDDEDNGPLIGGFGINLRALDLARLQRDPSFTFNSGDLADMVNRLRQGAMKRHSKTLLHDRMVIQLAERFTALGAEVFDDPDSVDLFTRWPDKSEAMFEVKTVTRRNIQTRLRSAVGQIEEYSYRRVKATGSTPDRVIVLNTMVESTAWQKDFLTEHLDISLLCIPTGEFISYPSSNSQTGHYWHKN